MENVLRVLVDHGAFDNEESKVSGIAQLAIDRGYESLSVLQKRVLEPFLTMSCTGTTDPGGHHNDCEQTLSGEDLIDAIELSDDGLEGMKCDSCRSDDDFYQHQWERIEQE